MTEFKRSFFKNDPVFSKLLEIIKKNHKVAKHTADVLYENRHIKDFCEKARHFVEMPGNPPLYIHYDTASWYSKNDHAAVKIESIGVYDNFFEYDIARLKGLHSGAKSDIPNIN